MAEAKSQENIEENKRSSRKGYTKFIQYFRFSTVIILVIIFTAMNRNFLNISNLNNILSDSVPLLFMSCGVTLILLLGSIDLSIGAVCSVVSVLMAKILLGIFNATSNILLATFTAFIVSLVFGGLAGFLLGFIHVRLKIPSFIASLGFMSIWASIAFLITKRPISIPKELWPAISWSDISFGFIGLPLIIAVVLIIVLFLVQSRTPFGKALYAIGGNERAARMAGININKVKILTFVLSGFTAASSAIFLVAKLKSSSPTVGDPFTLLVIAAVTVGGTSLSGGKGSVLRTILGVFIVAIIRNGMNFIGIDVFWQNIVFGAIVILSVGVSIDQSNRRNIIAK